MWKAWSATNLDCMVPWPAARVSMRPCSPHGSTWIRIANPQQDPVVPAGDGSGRRASGHALTDNWIIGETRHESTQNPFGGHSSLRPRFLACWPAWDWRTRRDPSGSSWLAHPGSCRWCWPCWAVCGAVHGSCRFINTRPKIPSNARSSSHWTRRRRVRHAGGLQSASGLAGAALVGWYGGQIIMSLPHGERRNL